MISNIIDAEKLNDDVDEKTADDEDKTEVLVTVENLPSKSMLIINTMKPSREKDEIAAAECTLLYHGVKHGHSYLSQQCLTNVCKTTFASSTVANRIIDLIDDADESAIKIFANARQFLLDKGLDMHGLTVLGADNTNVNVGHNHSVYSLFKDEVPDILKGTGDEVPCILSFLQHVLFEIHQKNLELQRYYTTAVDLFRVITAIKNKLQERIDSQFFGAACRYRLARLPIDTQNMLKTSFIEFLSEIISNAYVESAFSQMKHLLNDKRSRMTTELISAELKIRLNSTLSCTELYKYILSSEYLLRAIKSNEKYTFKRKCVQ
ncbi:unnamed protein product [Rotaria sp. Silwood1]|nr:unnamed protein product [Rotaria sp. Silwood1]CAF4568954.1 unnamed protein product [Rotaria sp. Silwood1]